MPIRALLVAIDNYAPNSPVPPLRGCLNDIAGIRRLLLSQLESVGIPPEKEADYICILRNAEATRAGLISAWRRHLGKATEGDTVLVYFSGHGSRSRTAPEFESIEPDGFEEGWVLYDSRLPGQFDMADKEIALLLKETDRQGIQLVVISDACHSGSVTRDAEEFLGWNVRYIPGSREPRPLSSYLDNTYRNLVDTGQPLTVPYTRHLAISACKNTEKALESTEKFGVFTRALLTAVEQTGAHISYSDLYHRICATIRRLTRQQNPQIEAFGGFNPQSGFLGNNLPPKYQRRYPLFFDAETQDWRIALGLGNGIHADMQQPVQVAVFSTETGGETLGTAELYQLNVSKSAIRPGNLNISKYETYWGIPKALPLQPLGIYCPAPETRTRVQATLDKQGESSILLLDQPEGCPITLELNEHTFRLYRTTEGTLVNTVPDTGTDAVEALVRVFDQIAHWHRVLELENHSTKLPENRLSLDLHIQDDSGRYTALDGGHFTFSLDQNQINFKLTGTNETGRDLHAALVYLSPTYGMQVFSANATKPMPDGTREFPFVDTYFHLPPGADEELDVFKLIVSTEPIDDTAFSKDALEPDGNRSSTELEQTRSIGGSLVKSDWLTKSVQVRLLRNAGTGTVGETTISLAGGQVRLLPHPTLRSSYRVTAPAATRGLDAVVLDHPFFQGNAAVQLVPLDQTVRSAGASYLDLTEIRSDAGLANHPWEIELHPERPDQLILPFWFDGTNFLPLGETRAREDGSLTVCVRNIPAETQAARTRSLGKALRLYVFKFVKDYGLPVNIQYLRWVEYLPDGRFERREAQLDRQVRDAQKITLLVHGIVGDTKTMVEAFRNFGKQPGHLVLCFDYENLKTPIEDTAMALKTMLEGTAGLAGKKIEIVAHSMGGLVARYFIERLNGQALVERLTMTGTPNAGSSLGSIPDYLNWVNGALGIGMKYFNWSLPALAGLMGALQFAKNELFITLKQLKPGSPFLSHLAAGAAPPVPYRVVAGDIRQFLKRENDPDFSEKILAQIGQWAYTSAPNDGAVSVESILAVKAADQTVVPGHHWGYFSDSANWSH
ncbi:MAG: caspase family protein [Saprospiraceae bacterium]